MSKCKLPIKPSKIASQKMANPDPNSPGRAGLGYTIKSCSILRGINFSLFVYRCRKVISDIGTEILNFQVFDLFANAVVL